MADIRDLLKQAAGTPESSTTPKTPANINIAAEAEAMAKKKREQEAAVAAEKAKRTPDAGRYGKK